MGQTIPIARNFDRGFVSDVSRDELPQNAAFRMADWIPQVEAPLRGRGGWSYSSPDLGAIGGTAASVASIGYLPFATDGHVVAVSNAGSIYRLVRDDTLLAGGSLITDTGDTSIVPSWPIFWHKTTGLAYGIILPGLSQAHKAPKKYLDTGALTYQAQALGGTPPQARFGFSWGEYLALGNYFDPNDSFNLKNNALVFSGVSNPDSWAHALVATEFDGKVSFPEEIIAGIPLQNGILVWGYNNCHILTGDTPPPGGNLSRRTLFAGNGTFDGRSAVPWRTYAVWANASGIWKSDGATLTDLTAAAGLSIWYRQLVAGFAFVKGWSAVAGVYRDHYFLTIRNAVGTVKNTLVIDLSRNVGFTFSNIQAANYAVRPAGPGTSILGGDEELYFAHKGSPRVVRLGSTWTPGSGLGSDADGTAVLPSMETPFYTLGQNGQKRLRRVYVSYEMVTDGAAPTIAVSYTTNPDVSAAYTAQSPALPVTAALGMKRAAVDIRKIGLGVAMKFALTAPASNLGMYGLELEAHPQEGTR